MIECFHRQQWMEGDTTMKPILIPQPKSLRLDGGQFRPPRAGSIAIPCASWLPAAEALRALFPGYALYANAPGLPNTVRLFLNRKLQPQGYTLDISAEGIFIEAADPEDARNAVRTLAQVSRQAQGGALPALQIKDWPDFPVRGTMLDLSRGRVPKTERLEEWAATLADYKINHLQLYIEHTFRYRAHPLVGKGASPLDAAEVLRLDAHAHARGAELIPALPCFGHMEKLLKHAPYRNLAEDWGIGRYAAPDADEALRGFKERAWTISPANADTYPFLHSLFAELLPLFRSDRVNICCDETFDLGLGQSYLMAAMRGKGNVYFDHVVKVAEMMKHLDKRAMFWGDVIRQYPELIPQLPKDLAVLDWGYGANHDFDAIGDFAVAGLECYACPGTSSWVSLFPRLHESAANIAGFAQAGRRHGAAGLINTDWGDGGHYNFMEYSWYGYLFGAEQAWNTKADRASFTRRFCAVLLGHDAPELAEAIDTLGAISHLSVEGYYQSVWRHIFFATPTEPLFNGEERRGFAFLDGRITPVAVALDAQLGEETLAALDDVRAVLAKYAAKKGDPLGLLPYWVFAVDTMRHAARKLAVRGPGGRGKAEGLRALRREMLGLLERFEELWLARSRPSELRIARALYRKTL